MVLALPRGHVLSRRKGLFPEGARWRAGPPRPGPLLNRPRGDKCSKQGKPSQANRGPKNLGRSKHRAEATEITVASWGPARGLVA
jgi:hypothetical protein